MTPTEAPQITQPLTTPSLKAVKARFHEKKCFIFDTIGKKQDGTFRATLSYFYRHGRSQDYLIQAVKIAFPEANIVSAGDHYAQWPARSYFYVIFKIEGAA